MSKKGGKIYTTLGFVTMQRTHAPTGGGGSLGTTSWEGMYAKLLKHRLVHDSFQIDSQITAHYYWYGNNARSMRSMWNEILVECLLCGDRIRKNSTRWPLSMEKANGHALNTNDLPKSWEEICYGELLAFRIQFQRF